MKANDKKLTLEEIQKWFKVNVSLLTIGEDEQGNDVLLAEDDSLIDAICALNEKAMQEYAELYHKEKLREDIMNIIISYHCELPDNIVFLPENVNKVIDEYLKTKE